jgi:two-component system, response regulator, stage 0 sporulation protein F
MRKILVVDDENDICDFVKNFFQERGFEVFTALSGEEALLIVKKETPSIVLLDIRMKGMDGIATLKHMKDVNKNMKIIMVTALDDQDRINEACRLGACEYITKPLALDNLEQTVEKMLK